MKYSDLTPADLYCLRIEIQLEQIYSDKLGDLGKKSASVILKGWEAWKQRHPTHETTTGRV